MFLPFSDLLHLNRKEKRVIDAIKIVKQSSCYQVAVVTLFWAQKKKIRCKILY